MVIHVKSPLIRRRAVLLAVPSSISSWYTNNQPKEQCRARAVIDLSCEAAPGLHSAGVVRRCTICGDVSRKALLPSTHLAGYRAQLSGYSVRGVPWTEEGGLNSVD